MKSKNEENAAIGEYIRSGLERSGMQQTELAKKIGITPSSLNMMISGASALPLRRFYQIASILRLTEQEIEDVNEIYRSRLMISPEQSKRFFINPPEFKELNEATASDNPSQSSSTDDYILNRIVTVYAQLDRASRAELLAATERIAEKIKEN